MSRAREVVRPGARRAPCGRIFAQFPALWPLLPGALPALGACLLLAGCAATPPARPAPPAGIMSATAPVPAGALGGNPGSDPGGTAGATAGTVEVVLDDVPPGRAIDAVALIDPAGGRHPASALVETRRESGSVRPAPSIGIGVTGGSSSGINPVVGLSLSLFGDRAGEGRSQRRVIARVPLGADAPGTDFTGWRIAVSVTEVTGERRILDLPLGATSVP
jgi:hypothetical protein